MTVTFDHRFAALPPCFYTKMPPEAVATKPKLIAFNTDIAERIGLDPAQYSEQQLADIFSGNQSLEGSDPLAMVYSGHQFGVWAGQLGDGRALLLGQARGKDNRLWDIQLKGSGLTPYSRMGDGRAVMRSSIREYLASIALHALDVPTSHALCLVASNNPVRREKIEMGAVLTRVAESHIRFGHFEHFAHHGMADQIPILLDHIIENYLPNYSYAEYLATIISRTAELIADWQAVGFAHGVMNTDNMSALGLTIDYGPYGFLDSFDLGFICNHSDHQGRYRFDRQPEIGHWNLLALCTALQSIIPWSESETMLQSYMPTFIARYQQRMLAKLGLPKNTGDSASDRTLWQDLLMLMQKSRADYSLTFRQLAQWLRDSSTALPFTNAEGADEWLIDYRNLAKKHGTLTDIAAKMDRVNPQYILRNWLAEEVIRAVEDDNNAAPLQQLAQILATPFDNHPNQQRWQQSPSAEYDGLAVSCSS